MTQDEIIEMAKEAGFPIFGTKVVANDPMQQMLADAVTQHYHDSAIQFAKLVAAKEREKIKHFLTATSVSVQSRVYIGDEEISMLKMTHEEIRARGEA